VLDEARSERLQFEAAAAEVRAAATEEANRLRERAEEDAEQLRRNAREDARDLVGQARAVTRDVLTEGTELGDELHQLSDSLRSNAELLLRDVRLAHARLTAQLDQANGGEEGRRDEPGGGGGGDFDVPEFLPRR
jgi:cell division septum initiation protein DivIVA